MSLVHEINKKNGVRKTVNHSLCFAGLHVIPLLFPEKLQLLLDICMTNGPRHDMSAVILPLDLLRPKGKETFFSFMCNKISLDGQISI